MVESEPAYNKRRKVSSETQSLLTMVPDSTKFKPDDMCAWFPSDIEFINGSTVKVFMKH